MQRLIRLATGTASAALLGLAGNAGADVVDTRELAETIPVAAGEPLVVIVKNVMGPNRVTGHDANTVELRATETVRGDLQADIEKVKSFYEGKMRLKEYSADTTDLMTRDLDGYAVTARELLPGKLELQSINNTADEIGSIQYTWRNFVNRISPTAIVIALLVSFILDGVVPLFTLLVVRPDNWY